LEFRFRLTLIAGCCKYHFLAAVVLAHTPSGAITTFWRGGYMGGLTLLGCLDLYIFGNRIGGLIL